MIKLQGSPKLQILKEAQNQIDALHSLVKRGTEWCGILIYSVDDSLPIDERIYLVKGVFPMEVGSPGYTEGEYSKYMSPMAKELGLKLGVDKFGYIHTHHSMNTFPSSVDDADLRKQAEDFPIGYLSLIVNYAGNYSCRLGVKVETSWNGKILSSDIGYYELTHQKESTIDVPDSYIEIIKNMKGFNRPANTHIYSGRIPGYVPFAERGYSAKEKQYGGKGWADIEEDEFEDDPAIMDFTNNFPHQPTLFEEEEEETTFTGKDGEIYTKVIYSKGIKRPYSYCKDAGALVYDDENPELI